jgi:hypothetical protein
MIAVVLAYLGLILSVIGLAGLLRSLVSKKGVMRALFTLACGLIFGAIGLTFPPTETYISSPRTQLDVFIPVFQFNEVDAIRVAAPPDRVYRAIKAVTPDEIALFKTLAWIRRLGQPTPESVLNAPGNLPLLEVATRSSFVMLADQPNREIVVGTSAIVPPGFQTDPDTFRTEFRRLRDPGFALAALNFLIEPDGRNGSFVTTETRVHATDLLTQQGFAVYWRAIYPGSSLIRHQWLRAIKRRAEGI